MKTNILNERNLSPVHLATELNKVKALQWMGKHRSVIDVQQGGEHGRTALHLAAIYDHDECARILVSSCLFIILDCVPTEMMIFQIAEFEACPRTSCNLGKAIYPKYYFQSQFTNPN